jgi:hypothetical protein
MSTPQIIDKSYTNKSNSKIIDEQKSRIEDLKQRQKSPKLEDDVAHEVKNENVMPYNMISQNTKNELLSKLKMKEKKNPNWITESQSSNALSYSKVFNASSKDHGKIGELI